MGVIFDLDQTLIDSRTVEALRNDRQWAKVYPHIPRLPVFPGISDLLALLRQHGVPVCVVTSSPRPYYSRIIELHGWPIDHSICFHDASPRKPHPAPILAGAKLLGTQYEKIIAVGDDPKDVIAGKAAGVITVAATWGCASTETLLETDPDHVCDTVEELRTLLVDRLKLGKQ